MINYWRSWLLQAAISVALLLQSAICYGLSPELALQVGHTDLVGAVAFSQDGTLLASGGDDKTLKLWNPRSGELLRTFNGSAGEVRSVVFLASDRTIASGSWDGTIKVWNLSTGRVLRTLVGHTGAVESIASSPDGKTLASAGRDGTLRLWDPVTGRLKRTIKAHGDEIWAVAFSPNGRLLATGSDDKTVRLWNALSGQLVTTLKGHTSIVNALAFSSDGKLLASGGDDQTIRLWDVQKGTSKATLTGHESKVTSLAFSPGGKVLMSASWDGSLKLWNVPTFKLNRTLTRPGQALVQAIEAVAFSPDGTALATGSSDATITLWNPRTWQVGRYLSGQEEAVNSVALTLDGRTLASGNDDRTVRLWDTRTGELRRTLSGHDQPVNCVAISSAGDLLASGSGSPNTRGEIRLWDAITGDPVRVLSGHSDGGINSLAFSPQGDLLASASSDQTIRLWDGHTGELRRTLTGHTDDVLVVAFSSDGHTLASGSRDGTLRLWDVRTGDLKSTIDNNSFAVKAVVFSPDGQVVAGGGDNRLVCLWDAGTGRRIRTWKHDERIKFLAFSPDGAALAVASQNDTIKLWDVRNGALRRTLAENSQSVNALVFSPQGAVLYGGSADNTVKMWHVSDGRLLATLLSLSAKDIAKARASQARPIPAVGKPIPAVGKPIPAANPQIDQGFDNDQYLVFTPLGYYTGSVEADRYVRFRLANSLFPAESFQAQYRRPDLVRSALAGRILTPLRLLKGPFPPTVRVVGLQSGEVIDTRTTEIDLEAADDVAVKSVVLLVNGKRYDAVPSRKSSKPIPATGKALAVNQKNHKNFHAVVDWPPESSIRLQVVAYDEDGLESPRDEVLLSRDVKAAATGRLLGLCVGISRYRDAGLNLSYADKDAEELSQALNRQRGLYSRAQVATLTNENATSRQVELALDQLVAQAQPSDTVMLLMSGHGWRDAKGGFFFATHEVNRSDVAQTALSWNSVIERLKLLSTKSRRVIVLLDACHSGSATTNEELTKATVQANAGVLVLSSSKGSEVSLELPELRHGAFTQSLLEIFNGKAAQGKKSVTIWDFVTQVRERVHFLTQDRQHPQVPYLYDLDTDTDLVARP